MDKTLNILKGMGSIFALSPTVDYKINKKTDAENLASDWTAVGDDIRYAINVVRNERTDIDFEALDLELRTRISSRLSKQEDRISAEIDAMNKELMADVQIMKNDMSAIIKSIKNRLSKKVDAINGR